MFCFRFKFLLFSFFPCLSLFGQLEALDCPAVTVTWSGTHGSGEYIGFNNTYATYRDNGTMTVRAMGFTASNNRLYFTLLSASITEGNPQFTIFTGNPAMFYAGTATGFGTGPSQVGQDLQSLVVTKDVTEVWGYVGPSSVWGKGAFVKIYPLAPVSQNQNITASSLSGSLAAGQSATGQASGAQGGNSYVITETGGGTAGSCNIHPTTGVFVISASTVGGPITFTIQALAGSGYLASNVLTGSYSITDAAVLDPYSPKKTLPITLTNTTSGVQEIKVRDSVTGAIYGVYTLQPGETQTHKITKTTSNAVVLDYTFKTDAINSALMTDGTFKDVAYNSGVSYSSQIIPDSDFNSSATLYQKPQAINTAPPATVIPSSTVESSSSSPVPPASKITTGDSSKISFSTAPAANNAPASDQTTREASGAIVDELQQLNSKADKLVKQGEELNDDKHKAETEKSRDSEATAANMIAQAIATYMGPGGKFDIASKNGADELNAAVPVVGAVTSFTGSTSELSMGPDIPMPGGGFIELKPFKTFPFFRTALLSMREVLLWGLAIYFYIICKKDIEKCQFNLSLVPQSTVVSEQITVMGNVVPGATTAVSLLKQVITATVTAGVIHVQIAVAILAMNSRLGEVIGTKWTWSNVGNVTHHVASSNPDFSLAFAFIDTSIPINACLMLLAAYFIFSWALSVSYGVAASTIRAVRI